MKYILFMLPLFVGLVRTPRANGDEGMWTFDHFPTAAVEKKYHFKANEAWLDNVRLSSVRLAEGCSGSFISKDGLVLTNHHCAHACIEQLSNKKRDYVASGFYAPKLTDEVRCPEIEINRLVGIQDVTASVRKATAGLQGQAFNDAQKAVMSNLEKDCTAGSETTRCDVVTLYDGGRYDLYKYQRYQDVRLVFAPEMSIAFFGGDPDNFMFPRYDLDMSLLRVYENNKPLVNENYFRWSTAPAKEDDLTFVTGHPGRTSRLLTVAELTYERDVRLLQRAQYLSEYRGYLTGFQMLGAEQKRISNDTLFSVENSLKAYKGLQQALIDPIFFAEKVKEEKKFRAKVNAKPAWKKEFGGSWDEISKAESELKKISTRFSVLEGSHLESRFFEIAKTLVRGAAELTKPNEKRFREFADSNLPTIKQDLLSSAPIYEDFEIAKLTFALTKMRERLTADDPFVRSLFGKRSPQQIAEFLVYGTKLKDVKLREKIWMGGQAQINSSTDPMIQFALAIDPESRKIRKQFEDTIEPVFKRASEKIAQARFAVYGTNTYPDATFTLRISYGQIKGYDENGHHVAPLTTIAGAFDRNTGSEPFALPASWLSAKDKLALSTPLNFCSTNDIIGGNSGSPVINANAELVGLIFDGNIQSLGGDYGFDPQVNRAVAVHSSAILETLQNVYGANRLITEIGESGASKW